MKFYQQIFYFNKKAFIAAGVIICLGLIVLLTISLAQIWFWSLLLFVFGTVYFTGISLLASYYIYDRSDLYRFTWLSPYLPSSARLYNIIAGYAESGSFLEKAFPTNKIKHLDFFEEGITVTSSIITAKNTTAPIESKIISYNNWQEGEKAETILFMQSLHELRSATQKRACLEEAATHLQAGGKIIVAEHLCDWRNFLIYGPGAFHFFGNRHYQKIFETANLRVTNLFTITPFVQVYILSV